MTARFGGRHPRHGFHQRAKILMGAFFSLITILLGTLVVLLHSNEPEKAPDQTVASISVSPLSRIEVVTARQRIEEGEQLRDEMMDSLELPVEKLPEGAVLYRDRHTLFGSYAVRMIGTSNPILVDSVKKEPPGSELAIPEGFRATTLVLDQRAGVGGWATPRTRVDVLCTYRDNDGEMKVRTIVAFAKVLSVNRCTKSENCAPITNGNDNITLLVSERDSRKLELARSVGAISLVRVSDKVSKPSPSDESTVTLRELFGEGAPQPQQQEHHTGTFTYTDPDTGRQQIHRLVNGRWRSDENS